MDGNFTIDELVSMLITMQEYAEERYLAEFHRVGSRPPMAEDPELTALAMQLSDYAFKMVVDQHKLAVGPSAAYDIEVDGSTTKITNPASGETHEVDARLSTCDCIFRQTCLLPCRHILFIRRKANYETVIPPTRTYSSRWIVQSPANNIDEGDVVPGAVNRVNCPPIRQRPTIDRDAKYSRAKQLTEKIVDVMSLQPSTTYCMAEKWLRGFHNPLHTGKLEDFTGQDPANDSCGFPSLSQISVSDTVTPSQLSFGGPSQSEPPEDKELPLSPPQTIQKTESAKAPSKTTNAVRKKKKAKKESAPDVVISCPAQSTSEHGTLEAPIVFASPPKRRWLSRRAEKKDASREDMKEAKAIALRVREGKRTRAMKLADMELLRGPYSRMTTKAIVDKLDLPRVEVDCLVVRGYNVGQPVPVITAIPQADRIRHAIQAIELTNDHSLLARWYNYGCATYEQLKLMEDVLIARNNFDLVQSTVEWVDKVEFQVDSNVEPFKDTMDVTKADHKQCVEELNLGKWFVGRHAQYGSEFLDFRENVWLHTGSVIGALFMLRESYEAVGVVNPRFLDFETTEQRTRLARSYGAAKPGVNSVISVVNVAHHWGSFFVDVKEKRCYLFDPMQLKSNITTLKTSVSTVVEGMLNMTDQLKYEVITGCVQKDSSSCGLWCLVVLELLLFGATPEKWSDYWNDSLYDVVGYLRLRYLHKVVQLQSHFRVVVEEEDEDA